MGGVYSSYVANPPDFTIPASGLQSWGKYPIRLRINSNPLQFEDDGSLNPAYDPDWTDEATILSVPSPYAQMPGFCFGEATQFDTLRSWAGSVMANLRALEAALLPLIETTGNAGFDFTALSGGNTTSVRSHVYVHGLTAAATVKFTASPFVGQQITISVDSSCAGANSVSVNPNGNALVYQTAGGLATSSTTQVAFDHGYESATWMWNGSSWALTSWVYASGAP